MTTQYQVVCLHGEIVWSNLSDALDCFEGFTGNTQLVRVVLDSKGRLYCYDKILQNF
jgi:hypothetical protein